MMWWCVWEWNDLEIREGQRFRDNIETNVKVIVEGWRIGRVIGLDMFMVFVGLGGQFRGVVSR